MKKIADLDSWFVNESDLWSCFSKLWSSCLQCIKCRIVIWQINSIFRDLEAPCWVVCGCAYLFVVLDGHCLQLSVSVHRIESIW